MTLISKLQSYAFWLKTAAQIIKTEEKSQENALTHLQATMPNLVNYLKARNIGSSVLIVVFYFGLKFLKKSFFPEFPTKTLIESGRE